MFLHASKKSIYRKVIYNNSINWDHLNNLLSKNDKFAVLFVSTIQMFHFFNAVN